MRHVEMVDGFGGFPATAVDAFNFVSDMPVVILFGQLCGGTIGSAADLGAQFVFFLGRPGIGEGRHVQMQMAEALIYNQVFNIPEFSHRLLFPDL